MSKNNLKIFVFGLGAIGSNLLLQLIKKYPHYKYHGIDGDAVEERNLLTQAYIKQHIGQLKARAITPLIGMKLSRSFNYCPRPYFIEDRAHIDREYELMKEDGYDYLVIDCFDNSKSRTLLHDYFQKDNIIHVGFSPQYTAEIIWGEHYSVPKDIPEDQNDICEMSDAIPFIQFIVSLACLNISDYIDSEKKQSLIVTNKTKIRYIS